MTFTKRFRFRLSFELIVDSKLSCSKLLNQRNTLHLISCIPFTISLSQEIVFNFIATSNLSYAYLSKQKVVIWTGIAVFLDSHIIKTPKCLTTIQNDTVGNIILYISNTNI